MLIEVTHWIDADETTEDMKCTLGGLGGWFGFKEKNVWEDYIESISEKARPYAEALKREVLRIELKEGGDWHQDNSGTPVFNDGSFAEFSFRGWGDIMAAIWTDESKDKYYNYMNFYMSCLIKEED